MTDLPLFHSKQRFFPLHTLRAYQETIPVGNINPWGTSGRSFWRR